MRRDQENPLSLSALVVGLALVLSPACAGEDEAIDTGDDNDQWIEDEPIGGGLPPVHDVGPDHLADPQRIFDGDLSAHALRAQGDRLFWLEDAGDMVKLSVGRPHGGPVIATVLLPDKPLAVVMIDEQVYWTAPQVGRIYRAPLEGGDATILFEGEAPMAMANTDKDLYFGSTDGCVRRLSIDGGDAESLGCGDGAVITVAVAEDTLHWATDAGALYRVALAGGDPEKRLGDQYFSSEIMVDQNRVYWIDAGARAILSVAHDDEVIRPIVINEYAPVSLSQDRFFLYYATQSDGAVKQTWKSAHTPAIVAEDQDHPTDVSLIDGRVYWLNEGDGTIMVMDL